MTATTGAADPFGTGPFQSVLHALHLPAGSEGAEWRRALLSILVAWVPLAILAQVQGLAIGTGAASLLQDFGAYSRFLVAVPLMVIAEAPARRWLGRTLDHFTEARLIAPEDHARFGALLTSTRGLLSSRWTLVVMTVLAYVLTLASAREWVEYGAASWTLLSHAGEPRVVSHAGWWRLLVSQPLFLSLVLTWLWRLLLWLRCMWVIAHMKLRIVASHPDRAGGLGFLGQSLRGFPVLAFALGTAIAGTLANLMMHDARASTSLTPVIAATVIIILVLCAGPLLAFAQPLREAQDDAELSYGAFATSLGSQFEEQWLARAPDLDRKALEVPDFSATADLYGVVGGVRDMRPIPVELKDFIPLLIGTLLPFVPILLRNVSFADLLSVGRRMLM